MVGVVVGSVLKRLLRESCPVVTIELEIALTRPDT